VKDFVTSGSITDIVYALPAIRDSGGGNLYIRGMPELKLVHRLCEMQEYISKVALYSGEEVDVNFDLVRSVSNMEFNPMVHSLREISGLPYTEKVSPWLSLAGVRLTNYPSFTIVNRSLQYHDSSDSWIERMEEERGTDGMFFLGFKEEYDSFVRNIAEIQWLDVTDLVDMALLIQSAKRVIAGPGIVLALSQGLGKTVEIEVDRNRSINYLI
jgi:hypothetical protein